MPKNPLLHGEMGKVWAVAWPLIVTNLLNVTVSIVDLKMVGRLGVESIAAVGMAGNVIDLMMVIMIAISGGSSILVAHAYGARERKKVSEIAARSIVFMIVAAVAIVTPLGLFFSRRILFALGGEEDVVRLGEWYLHIMFLGSVFAMFNFAVTGVLLGVGKTKVSLILLLGINVLNVALNFIFIFGVGPIPAMGVAGAALGSIVARAIGAVAGVWITKTRRLPLQVEDRLSRRAAFSSGNSPKLFQTFDPFHYRYAGRLHEDDFGLQRRDEGANDLRFHWFGIHVRRHDEGRPEYGRKGPGIGGEERLDLGWDGRLFHVGVCDYLLGRSGRDHGILYR